MMSCKGKSHDSSFRFQSVVLWYEQLLVLTAVSASWKELYLYTVCSVLNALNTVHSLFFIHVRCLDVRESKMCVYLHLHLRLPLQSWLLCMWGSVCLCAFTTLSSIFSAATFVITCYRKELLLRIIDNTIYSFL